MMLPALLHRVRVVIGRGLQTIRRTLSRWAKPISGSQISGPITDLARSKPQLVAENVLLRQQLIVLNRSLKRPHFKPADRCLFILLASKLQSWREALLIVKPDTVLRWHREGFRLFWKWKSRAISREPQISPETIRLIKEMAAKNRLWGAERIRGELLKGGIKVAKRTVQRYMRHARPPKPHGQTWATFLQNHANDIWACDFLQVTDIFFRPLFAFIITELGSRRIAHVGVTRAPTDAWVAQQLREATPFGEAPRYLIRDNDAKYGRQFDAVAVGSGLEVVRTPIKAPRANAICERLLGSVRRECLDHVLIMSDAHLHHVLKEYLAYFNHSRPHQGINQRRPGLKETSDEACGGRGRVISLPILGGLHHDYRRAA